MHNRLPSFLQLRQYGISSEDIVKAYLGCSPDQICPRVILTPTWGADIFREHVESVSTVSDKVTWQLRYEGKPISVIRSGMGAPPAGDCVLALGCTPCETIVLVGSVGGLDSSMEIGDLVVAESAISGDGFSRHLQPESEPTDCFFATVLADARLTKHVKMSVESSSLRNDVPLHCGAVFSTDTILAQFFRIDHIVQTFGCIGIEMEASAAFKAAELVDIQATGLLQVSDLASAGKSLFCGRTETEMKRRSDIKRRIFPRLVLDSLIGWPA